METIPIQGTSLTVSRSHSASASPRGTATFSSSST